MDSEEKALLKEARAKARRRREKRRERKRRKAAMRGCRAEFDYGGWKGWNVWRREVWALREEVEKELSERGRGRGRVLTRSRTRGGREASGELGRVRGRAWCAEVYTGEEAEGAEDYSLCENESGGHDELETRGRSRGRSRDQREDCRGGKRVGNCWLDCDFPSQCHNERKAEREWQEKLIEMRRLDAEWMEREMDRDLNIALEEQDPAEGAGDSGCMDVDPDEYGGRKRRKSFGDFGEDDEVYMAGVGEWDEDEDGDTVMSDADMDFESEDDANAWAGFDPVSGKKSGSYIQSHDIPIGLAITTDAATYPSIEGEETKINFTASGDKTGLENLGPIGVDSDGLGEVGYQLSHIRSIRRKSIEGSSGESPPSSPLKECSFGCEDLVGGDLGVKSARDSSVEDEHQVWKHIHERGS